MGQGTGSHVPRNMPIVFATFLHICRFFVHFVGKIKKKHPSVTEKFVFLQTI
jgi:hypothetical protein